MPFSQQAVDMTKQFMGAGGSGAQPGSRFPRGVNVGNMREFAGSPAGKALMGHIRKNVSRPKRARAQSY